MSARLAFGAVALLSVLILASLGISRVYFARNQGASYVVDVVIGSMELPAPVPIAAVRTSLVTSSSRLPDSTRSPTQIAMYSPVLASRRRQLVYIYDWWTYCKSIGLCAEATPKASRAAACINTTKQRYQCQEDPYGPETINFTSPWLVHSDGVVVRHTHQFSASALYNARLFASQWRTLDPDKAELFYIPYDPDIDYTNFNATFSRTKLEWLRKHVVNSKYFKRFKGRDHFMVISLCKQYMLAYTTIVDATLNFVTKLSIENYVYQYDMDIIGRTQHVSSNTKVVSTWATTVYPSFFHPTKTFVPNIDACKDWEKKDLLVVMSFATKTINQDSNWVRQQLYSECAAAPDLCTFRALYHFGEFNLTDFQDTVELYKRAKYCVVPRGDTYTSKRYFDAIGACCVPVLGGVKTDYWKQIYSFTAFRDLINALNEISFSLKELQVKGTVFAKMRKDNGTIFERLVPLLRESVMPLSYAWEEHPYLFDAVDVTLDTLLRNGSVFATAPPKGASGKVPPPINP